MSCSISPASLIEKYKSSVIVFISIYSVSKSVHVKNTSSKLSSYSIYGFVLVEFFVAQGV